MKGYQYERFLQEKLKDQHTMLHLSQAELTLAKQTHAQLLASTAMLRLNQSQLKLKNAELQQRVNQLQMEVHRLKELRQSRQKKSEAKRARVVEDPRRIFREYLDNTFPKYKGMLRQLLKILFVMENASRSEPQAKIVLYRSLFEGVVKRVLNWLFPRERGGQLSEKQMKEWKAQIQEEGNGEIQRARVAQQRESGYIKRIEQLQASLLQVNASKSLLEGRLKSYQRSLQYKGAEFAAHIRKMLTNDPDLDEETQEKIHEIMQLLAPSTDKIVQQQKPPTEGEKREIVELEEVNTGTVRRQRKAPPVLRKNIFGYYPDPQLPQATAIPTPTRHPCNSRSTQTLADDLTLLSQPLLLLTLIDATIRPQRNRHSVQFYVRAGAAEWETRVGLQPQWHQSYLLRQYDLPSLQVKLMHKSKGLRDNAVGQGRLPVALASETIVSVQRDKEFQGRVRFALERPKGEVYEFHITSVKLEGANLPLKVQVGLTFPCNPHISLQFILPQRVIYPDRHVLLLAQTEQSAEISSSNIARKVQISLQEFTKKEGHCQITVTMSDDCIVIIQGEAQLVLCEEETLQPIPQELLEGGEGRFFSVRAPPPAQKIIYAPLVLPSSKHPIVLRATAQPSLTIVREDNHQIIEQNIDLFNGPDLLKVIPYVRAPKMVHLFLVQSKQGGTVRLKKAGPFERIPEIIWLILQRGQGGKQRQFSIQSNLLLVNHYRVFTKHFKKIGFVKFKLGYITLNNLLRAGDSTKEEMTPSAVVPWEQSVIQVGLSESHLPTHSSLSKFSCLLNGIESSRQSGNHPHWNQSFSLAFASPPCVVAFQIQEHSLTGTRTLYKGDFQINAAMLHLGHRFISLSEEGDCLHLQVRFPSKVVRLRIDSVQAEIDEEADWIGKIDPYLALFAGKRTLLTTDYLDNAGSRPVWKDFNLQLALAVQQSQEQELLSARLMDYDLIGRDDYLGEALFTFAMNPQLQKESSTSLLSANLVKDASNCGWVRLRGQFELFNQQLPSELRFSPLSRISTPYVQRVTLHELKFKEDEYDGEMGWLKEEESGRQWEVTFQESNLSKLNLVIWTVGDKQIRLELVKERKGFFNKAIHSLGRVAIHLRGEFEAKVVDIVHQQRGVIGTCSFVVELPPQIKYVLMNTQTLCRPQLSIRSDLNDTLTFKSSSVVPVKSPFFYDSSIQYTSSAKKWYNLTKKDNVLEAQSHEDKHSCSIALLQIQDYLFKNKIQENTGDIAKRKELRKFKQIKHLHWEPNSGQDLYSITLKTKNGGQITLQLAKALREESHVLNLLQNAPIFDCADLPSEVTITKMSTNTIMTTVLLSPQGEYKDLINKKGALLLQTQQFMPPITEIRIQSLFIRLKQGFKDHENISVSVSLNGSMRSMLGKAIMSNCFLFKDESFLVEGTLPSGILSLTAIFYSHSKENSSKEEIGRQDIKLRLQSNKAQYRWTDTPFLTAHARFSSALIPARTSTVQPQAIEESVYFIEIETVEFLVGEDAPGRGVWLEIDLEHQHEKIIMQRKEGDVFGAKTCSIFHLKAAGQAQIAVFEGGILSQRQLGTSQITLTPSSLTSVSISSEVRKNGLAMGKVTIRYRTLNQPTCLQITLQSLLRGFPQRPLSAEIRSQQHISRLELDKSNKFWIIGDPRQYQITVSQRDSQKLLGEFILGQSPNKGEILRVLQPLRVSSQQLEGLAILELSIQPCSMVQQMSGAPAKKNGKGLLQVSLANISFNNHLDKISQEFTLSVRTPNRQNCSALSPISKVSNQTPIKFIIPPQSMMITLSDRSRTLGEVSIQPPYIHLSQLILPLSLQSVSIGLCTVSFRWLATSQIEQLRQIVSIEASQLRNTQLFAKMQPYVELHGERGGFMTGLGLGRERVFWKVGVISSGKIKLTVKDRDIFFDDLVGSSEMILQKGEKDRTYELQLSSQQGEQGGKLKVLTSNVIGQGLEDISIEEDQKIVKSYLLKVGRMTEQQLVNLKKADRIQILLIFGNQRQYLYQESISRDADNWKDRQIQVALDTAQIDEEKECYVAIIIQDKKNIIAQQIISLSQDSVNLPSSDIFQVKQLIPLSQSVYTLSSVALWLQKPLQNPQIFAFTRQTCQQLVIDKMDGHLLIMKPWQLLDLKSQELQLCLYNGEQEVCRIDLTLPSSTEKRRKVVSGPLPLKNGQERGVFYVEVIHCQSNGERNLSLNHIYSAQRKWLLLQICQAFLTKDLQIFSKMDPYCIATFHSLPPKRTSIQDNIGLHPVWNELFAFPFSNAAQKSQQWLDLTVMDSEVTKDRLVGRGRVRINEVISKKLLQVDLRDEEGESGKVKIKGRLTNRYVVFRRVVVPQGKKIGISVQNNQVNKNGEALQFGMPYPLDQDTPLSLSINGSILQVPQSQLLSSPIVIPQHAAALYFELYQ